MLVIAAREVCYRFGLCRSDLEPKHGHGGGFRDVKVANLPALREGSPRDRAQKCSECLLVLVKMSVMMRLEGSALP